MANRHPHMICHRPMATLGRALRSNLQEVG